MITGYTKTVDGYRWLLSEGRQDDFTVVGYKNSPIVYRLTSQKRAFTDSKRTYFIFGTQLTFDSIEARSEFMKWNQASVIFSDKPMIPYAIKPS